MSWSFLTVFILSFFSSPEKELFSRPEFLQEGLDLSGVFVIVLSSFETYTFPPFFVDGRFQSCSSSRWAVVVRKRPESSYPVFRLVLPIRCSDSIVCF